MSVFISFVRKEFTHILRDPRTMLIVLLLPIVLMTLFGFALSTEINNINIMTVIDRYTLSTRAAIGRLEVNPYITYLGEIHEQQVDQMLRSGKADAVVFFRADDKRHIVLDASNSTLAAGARMYVQSIISDDNTAQPQALFATYMRHNPQLKSAYNFVPGLIGLLFILICALMTCVSVVKEKEMGTMEVLLVSPVKPIYVIISKMVPYFVISCINLTIILLMARYILDMPPVASMGALLTLSLLYIVLSLALGLFVSNMAQSQMVALLICAMLMLVPMIMLSGLLFPLENLPIILKQLTYIVPARWYNEALRKVMIEGLGFAGIWKEMLILCSMTLVLMVASMKKFNDRLE